MKYTLQYILFLAISLSSTGVCGQNTIEAYERLLALTTDNQVVGVSAGYSVDGEVKWQNATGYSNRETGLPFTTQTLTRLASIAKPMTAIAIMQLVESGKVNLDAPVQEYLPAFPNRSRAVMTVRQVMGHTAGIDAYKSSKETESIIEYATLQDAMEIFQDRKLKFEPGSDFLYTSYGYIVLGRIIEVVSGMTYEEYMQQNIWDKAGMVNTGIEKYDVQYTNKSELYTIRKKLPIPGEKNNLSNRTPAGGFYSTLEDMLKFGNAVVNNTLISEESLDLITTNQNAKTDGNPYALGWFLYGPAPHQNVVIGHSGEQTGAATQLMLIPRSKTVIVVLANTSHTWKSVIQYSTELIRISESE